MLSDNVKSDLPVILFVYVFGVQPMHEAISFPKIPKRAISAFKFGYVVFIYAPLKLTMCRYFSKEYMMCRNLSSYFLRFIKNFLLTHQKYCDTFTREV